MFSKTEPEVVEVAAEEPVEAVVEETSETPAEESTEATEKTEEEASEEVAKFPVRDEKIPPYEIALRDGTTVKLDQFEGKVVMLTFFTTW